MEAHKLLIFALPAHMYGSVIEIETMEVVERMSLSGSIEVC